MAGITASLEEPGVGAHAAGAVHALGHPRVVVVDHAVLLPPPVERRHEEHQAKHPPHNCDLHSVELLQVCCRHALALGALLLQPIPQRQLHDLSVLWAMDTTPPQYPVLGHGSSVGVGHGAQGIAVATGNGLPAAHILLVASGPNVLEARC